MTFEQAHRFLEVKQHDMAINWYLYSETAISVNGKAIEAVEKQIQKSHIIIWTDYTTAPLVELQ